MLFATIEVRTPIWLIVLQALCYGALMSEAYPTEVRATAQNVLWNIGRAVGGLGPIAVGFVASTYTFQIAVAMLAGIYLIDIIATVFLIPELKGSELR